MLRLLTWLSPSYPVGAFSYSHGLENAVERGLVHDAATLQRWIETLLRDGSGFSDAVFFAAVMRSTSIDDWDALSDDCAALRPTAELALESEQQGAAFLRTTLDAWPAPSLDALRTRRQGRPLPYPIAVAAACVAHGIDCETALPAYLHAFAANLISAGLRAIPLGQTDGQRVTAALLPCIEEVAALAMRTSVDELGTAALGAELCSMHHETQYTRLFRS